MPALSSTKRAFVCVARPTTSPSPEYFKDSRLNALRARLPACAIGGAGAFTVTSTAGTFRKGVPLGVAFIQPGASQNTLSLLGDPEVRVALDTIFTKAFVTTLTVDVMGNADWKIDCGPITLDGLFDVLSAIDRFVVTALEACVRHNVTLTSAAFREPTLGVSSGAPVSSGLFRK